MKPRSIVEVKALSKCYRRARRSVAALVDVSFEVELGEFIVLTGSSGAGKTTLLNLLAALDHPDRGEVIVAGKNIAQLSLRSAASYRRFQVGIIFQAYNLLPQLTAVENVALPMIAAGNLDMRRAEDLLQSVGLGERTFHRATELSGGEQQRVAIARALANHPQLVLADEPTGNLDEDNAKAVMHLLVHSCQERGATLIVATHDVGGIAVADRAFALQAGHLEPRPHPSA